MLLLRLTWNHSNELEAQVCPGELLQPALDPVHKVVEVGKVGEHLDVVAIGFNG